MHTTKARAVAGAVSALAALLVWALPASASATSGATTKATIVKVTAGKPSEFRFTLSAKSVKVGTVSFTFTNKGELAHTLKFCSSPKGGTANSCAGKGTPQVEPGKSTTLTVRFAKAGSYEYLCTVPGHAAAGMKGVLKVT